MISIDLKSDVSKSSPLSLSSKDEESDLSFSELLKGIKTSKDDDKPIQNGVFVLALQDKEHTTKLAKTSNIKTILTKDDEVSIKEEPLELNPKLASALSSHELKTLINDAKKYLKSKILESDDYKKSQIKELPKTLKGLAQLAKKLHIDISKITIQDVKLKDSTPILHTGHEDNELKPETPIKETKTEIKPKPKLELALETKTEIKPKPKLEQALETKTEIKPKLEQALETKTEIKPQPNLNRHLRQKLR